MEEIRYCSRCGKEMQDGYVVEDGFEYFCSDDCLFEGNTFGIYPDTYLEDYEDGVVYWTELDLD